jgi:hypothetical protein
MAGQYGPVYSIAAFHILDGICRILGSGRYAHPLRMWIGGRAGALAVPPQTVPKAREGALLAPRARSVLVPMAWWLMADWPDRFVTAAQAVGMTCRDVLKKPKDRYPFAYAHPVDQFVREPSGRSGGSAEVKAAMAALHRQGRPATQRNLIGMFGAKIGTIPDLAEPAGDGAGWGQGRYWKLDGVSPEVKAAAREAAHRAGEGVGSWLEALLRRELGLIAASPARPSFDTIQGKCTIG